MTPQDRERALFQRVWNVGAREVLAARVSALTYLANKKPTLEEYRNSRGAQMVDMINLVKLGISKLHATGELQEP